MEGAAVGKKGVGTGKNTSKMTMRDLTQTCLQRAKSQNGKLLPGPKNEKVSLEGEEEGRNSERLEKTGFQTKIILSELSTKEVRGRNLVCLQRGTERYHARGRKRASHEGGLC